jgi:hypothetical protein
MSRPSTSCFLISEKKDVDARIRGHDEKGAMWAEFDMR